MKRLYFVIAIILVIITLSVCGCSSTTTVTQQPPTTVTQTVTQPFVSPRTTPPTSLQTTLEIYDVSVVTSSSVGQIKVGANPDRWETAVVGQVEISFKTNLPTRCILSVQVTGNPGSLLGYVNSFGSPSYTVGAEPPFQTMHSLNQGELCPSIAYKYQIFCTDQEGRQVSYSGTFLPN